MSSIRLKILVVDDDPKTLETTAMVLEDEGHVVMKAATGEDAMQAARRLRVDMVIVDVTLPDCDGRELVNQIRDLYPVQAVALSGYGRTDDKARFEQAGFDAFLEKPLDYDRLLATVSEVAQGARRRPTGCTNNPADWTTGPLGWQERP